MVISHCLTILTFTLYQSEILLNNWCSEIAKEALNVIEKIWEASYKGIDNRIAYVAYALTDDGRQGYNFKYVSPEAKVRYLLFRTPSISLVWHSLARGYSNLKSSFDFSHSTSNKLKVIVSIGTPCRMVLWALPLLL